MGLSEADALAKVTDASGLSPAQLAEALKGMMNDE